MINPINILSSLIALATDRLPLTSNTAIQLLYYVKEKHVSMIKNRFCDGIQEGYNLRKVNFTLSQPPLQLTVVYNFFNLNDKKAILKNLVEIVRKPFGNDLFDKQDLYEYLFILETLLLLQYTKTTELDLIIDTLKNSNVYLNDAIESIAKSSKNDEMITSKQIAQLIYCTYAVVGFEFIKDYYAYDPNEKNNEIITAQISDLNVIDHPFVKAGFKEVKNVFEKNDILSQYYKYAKKINQGVNEAFVVKKKKGGK